MSVNGAGAATTPARHRNTIACPLARGQKVTIPKDYPVRTMNPAKPHGYFTGRATTVTIAQASPGWIDLWNDARRGRGYVHLPTITWAGTGGYWCDVKVTPELCEVLGVPAPVLPDLHVTDVASLDYEPSFGVTTDNRDA